MLFVENFKKSEQAKRAAENATQSATDEPRPEPSGSSEATAMVAGLNLRGVSIKKVQHPLWNLASRIEKPRWVCTSCVRIVNALKKYEIRRKGVELREKILKEMFREILLEEKKVEDRCVDVELIGRNDVKSFNTQVKNE